VPKMVRCEAAFCFRVRSNRAGPSLAWAARQRQDIVTVDGEFRRICSSELVHGPTPRLGAILPIKDEKK
jgi:hypothetical protein